MELIILNRLDDILNKIDIFFNKLIYYFTLGNYGLR